MALPRWLAQVNKRVFNPRELKRGKRPVLTHVGRASGKTFRTPLDAHRVEGGFLFFPLYGPRSDWVRNVTSSGTAQLDVDGEQFALDNPRLVTSAVAAELLADGKKPPGRVTDFLQMDVRG